jgi:hypothetical protein
MAFEDETWFGAKKQRNSFDLDENGEASSFNEKESLNPPYAMVFSSQAR